MKTNLKNVDGERTPERQALAEAIAAHAKATERLARLTAALRNAEDGLYGETGAMRGLDRAEAKLREAKENESRHLAAVAVGDITAGADPVSAAERALSDANTRLDAARKTKKALEDEIKTATDDEAWASSQTNKATRAVLRDEAATVIERLMHEAAALQQQLGATRAILSFLKDAAYDWQDTARLNVSDFLAAPIFPREWNHKPDPAVDAWQAAVDALREDADAQLPM